jgi:hypothetical protein
MTLTFCVDDIVCQVQSTALDLNQYIPIFSNTTIFDMSYILFVSIQDKLYNVSVYTKCINITERKDRLYEENFESTRGCC